MGGFYSKQLLRQSGSYLAMLMVLLLPRSHSAVSRSHFGATSRGPPRGSARLAAAGPRSLVEFLGAHDANAQLLFAQDSLLEGALDLKTLLFVCDGELSALAFAIVADADRVDEVRLAAALGVSRVSLAPRAHAEEVTGFTMGTLPPCGSRCASARTVIDERVAESVQPVVGGGGESSTRLLLPSAGELMRLLAAAGARPLVATIAFGRRQPGRQRPSEAPALPAAASPALSAPVWQLPAVDLGGERVQLRGVVSAKRPMAKSLCFITLLPHPQLLRAELQPETRWDSPRALWRPVGLGFAAEPRPVGVQIILGKALEGSIGRPALIELIRRLRVGTELSLVVAPVLPAPSRVLRWLPLPAGLQRMLQRRALRARVLRERQVDLKCLSLSLGPTALLPGQQQAPARPTRKLGADGGALGSGSGSSEALGAAAAGEAAEAVEWLRLPAGVAVLLVDSAAAASEAALLLLREVEAASASDSALLALDLEWQPELRAADGSRARSPPALLQLATREWVLLLDLLALTALPRPGGQAGGAEEARLPAELGAALELALRCAGLLKLSLGGHADLQRLCAHFASDGCFRAVGPQCDIGELATAALPGGVAPQGLANLAAHLLGARLDKRLQCAPWAERPLLPEMLRYAALDAHVLIPLYDRLRGADLASSLEPWRPAAPLDGGRGRGAARAGAGAGAELREPRPAGEVVAASALRVRPGLDALLRLWLGQRVPQAQGQHVKDTALILAAQPQPARSPELGAAQEASAAAAESRADWAPAAQALRGLERRSGLAVLADALVVFVSFAPSSTSELRRGRGRGRKYANEMSWSAPSRGAAAPHLELSWWLPEAVGAGHPLFAQLVADEPAPRERLLFARLGRAQFVFLGRLRFSRHLDPLAAGSPGGGLAWTLADTALLMESPTEHVAKILRVALLVDSEEEVPLPELSTASVGTRSPY